LRVLSVALDSAFFDESLTLVQSLWLGLVIGVVWLKLADRTSTAKEPLGLSEKVRSSIACRHPEYGEGFRNDFRAGPHRACCAATPAPCPYRPSFSGALAVVYPAGRRYSARAWVI
jgi:hypothetical protein